LRLRHRPTPATIIATVALFVALGGAGMAATGDNFILGKQNSSATATSLSAPVAGGKTLQLSNTDTTTAGSTALGLTVGAGHPPFSLNSRQQVPNLNADLLDGLNAKDAYWSAGGSSGQQTLPNGKGTWTTIGKTSFTTHVPSSWIMFAQDNVGFMSGGSATTSNVDLRFLVNGAVADGLLFPGTVSPGSVQSLVALLKCNGMPAGAYTIVLQADAYAADGSFTSRVGSLAVAGSGTPTS